MKSLWMSYVMACVLIGLSTVSFASSNNLTSLVLDKEMKTAEACATVAVFKVNELFRHEDFRGYVIKISGDESIFDGLGDDAEACVTGPYKIDSRGFAPQLLISDVELVEDPSESDDEEALEETLEEAVERVHTEWGDNNISTGVARLRLAKVKDVKATTLNLEVLKVFQANLKDIGGKLVDKKAAKSTSKKFSSARDIGFLTKIVVSANAFSPENRESRRVIKESLQQVTSLLGSEKDLQIVTVKAMVKGVGPDDDALESYQVLVVHKKTKQLVQIFTLEGTM